MNVYDFDKTIYANDSTRDFYFFLISKNLKVLKCLPPFFIDFIKYKKGYINKTKMKETFYKFLLSFNSDEIDKLVEKFWTKNKYKIYKWYLMQKNDDDIIISASPRFLLTYICNQLGIKNLICSEVDKLSGKYLGLNCYGDEKVKRFYEKYPNEIIDNFYSDSYSDEPLAKCAKKAYMIKRRGKITPWKFKNDIKKNFK